MSPGVRGRLLRESFLREVFPTLTGVAAPPREVAHRFASWIASVESTLGPSSGPRKVADVALVPLVDLLGFALVARRDDRDGTWIRFDASGSSLVAMATAWGAGIDHLWRLLVAEAVASDARWCLCSNGQVLRLVDTRRTWSRDHLELDLAVLGREIAPQTVLWSLVRADALAERRPLIDRAIELSREHGVHVCRSLGDGVLAALRGLLTALSIPARRRSPPVLFEQSLTVLYRVLFLLFAEARGLVPVWHPVYRDRYSLDAIVTTLAASGQCRGLWRAVQAISRLAHEGCMVEGLRVTPFNGRLFAPAHATAFDEVRVSDAAMGEVLLALGTVPGPTRTSRARIAYRDMDVEQLGAVYERVLEYEPSATGPALLTRSRDPRKSSGAFYTPRSLTAYLVRRTLEPLVNGRRSEDILNLRVLDPAMGSGAFLVATCRYLASAVESALIEEGRWHAYDITASDRADLRRQVAARCLFGVDVNPMAVQLARLSLWLATLADGKPLSFLDHHLLAGNSLIGAGLDELLGRTGGGQRSRRRPHDTLPLFEEADLPAALDVAARLLSKVSRQMDDSPEVVRAKERSWQSVTSPQSSIGQWSRVLDLWCATWFWDAGEAPDRATFGDLSLRLLNKPCLLPARKADDLLATARTIATRHAFFHWRLAFPEVFQEASPGGQPGFDAVVGNPPWDMVRGDSGNAAARAGRQWQSRRLTSFVRQSGVYRLEGRGHLNVYQLFVDRALQLVKPGGRLGLVVPAGLASDAGAASLRRNLFDRADVDEMTGFHNREAIFPVHRSVKFLLLTCTEGRPTTTVRCRFGLSKPEECESPTRRSLALSRRFLTRLSGEDDLGIPEITSAQDLSIVEAVSAALPPLGTGWNVAFGRELNATEDRDAFVPARGAVSSRPVVEGKHLDPFRVAMERCRFELRASSALRVGGRARLAYRDVASAGNRLTLIAAIVPARAVTTHTLFCLKTRLPEAEQRVLCALLNSYVANYLVRLRVNTHVTVSLVSRLPVPVVRVGHQSFDRLAALAAALAAGHGPVETMDEHAEMQAVCARLYGLSLAQFEHLLSTFPLVPARTRQAALERFRHMAGSAASGQGSGSGIRRHDRIKFARGRELA